MAQRLTQARARMGGVSLAALMVAAPLLVVAPQDALAQAVEVDGVVEPGSPNVTSRVFLISGETLTVDAGASITTTASDAVETGASATVTIINAGVIESTQNKAIDVDNILLLINSGTISGSDDGIDADTITSLINSGTISGGNSNDDGINAETIVNLVNSGTISGSDDGIQADTITSLINSGTISGEDEHGVNAEAITSLTNSGTIRGGDSAIEQFGGTADTQLILLEGSVIEGGIDLGLGVNTLSVGRGLSLATTIEELDAVGSTSGSPFVTDVTGVNTLVVVIDPTSLGLTDEGLADLTGGIFGVLSSRQSGFGGSGSGFAAGDDDASSGPTSMANARVHTAWNVWGEVFGSYRVQDGSGNATDTTSGVGGLVIGADGAFSDTLTLGGFLGGAWGQSETDSNTQETDTTSVFAGVYGAFVQPGVTYDFALVGGHSRYDRERQVANNLVAGGLETASADYNGWFLSPELTVRATQFQHFEPFVTLRYAGLFLDDVTETGTAAPLTLESQTLHLATGRLGITLPYEWAHGNGSETRLRLTGGVEARRQFGGTTQRGVLLGQSIAFEAGETDAVFGGFVGLDVSHQMSASTALYASGEALFETGNAMQLSARAGVRMAF